MKKRILFHAFGTPVTLEGWAWVPFAWAAAWGLFTWLAGRKNQTFYPNQPQHSLARRAALGAAQAGVVLGSEWAHNLAHAAAARWVGKPMDELKVLGGLPLCVYADINDRTVSPNEHIARALGGPLFNLALMLDLRLVRALLRSLGFARPGSFSGETLDTAVSFNTFLATASYVPIPALDGGPLVKWTLVQRGASVAEADAQVMRLNGWLAGPFSLLGFGLLQRGPRFSGRWWLGSVLVQFGLLSALVALGWIKEEKYIQIREKI